MYTISNGSTPTPPMWVEERHSIFPFPRSWNKLFNTLHVSQIATVTEQTFLIYSLPPILRTILTLSFLLLDLQTTFLSMSLVLLHVHHHYLTPNAVRDILCNYGCHIVPGPHRLCYDWLSYNRLYHSRLGHNRLGHSSLSGYRLRPNR